MGDMADLITGRSPRARGRPSARQAPAGRWRSIPACAGETDGRLVIWASSEVDPRVRGGDAPAQQCLRTSPGRSPRARGRHVVADHAEVDDGSIPACAGETIPRRIFGHAPQVDPRVRGGDRPIGAASELLPGRSPRARGRHHLVPDGFRSLGSIPACAGETITTCVHVMSSKVDPRVRGGDTSTRSSLRRPLGRSPRARGRLSAVSLWC